MTVSPQHLAPGAAMSARLKVMVMTGHTQNDTRHLRLPALER